MARYPHWLKRIKSKSWPGRVLCVGADWTDVKLSCRDGEHLPILADISIQPIHLEQGKYTYRPMLHGLGENWFWYELEQYARKGKSLVVMSADTSRLWAMLGLWDRLERGAVLLVKNDVDTSDPVEWACKQLDKQGHKDGDSYSLGDIRREIEGASGYLCLSAPPLVIRFLIPQRNAWITWVDIANYDAFPTGRLGNSKAVAEWLAQTHIRLHDTWRENALGPWRPTSGGIAMAGFLHSSYRGGIHIDATPETDKLARAAYYSGRAECFRLGPIAEPLWCVDYKACYASIMTYLRVPVRLENVYDHVECHTIMTTDLKCCIADVTISTAHPCYPRRYAWGTAWPIGRFRTVLAGPELDLAFECDELESVHSLHEYALEPALAEYATKLCKMRDDAEHDGEHTLAGTLKFATNSFAGRWAQRSTGWEVVKNVDTDIGWGEFMGAGPDGSMCVYRSLGAVMQRQRDDGLADDASPAIAAWITSAARVKLWNDILFAGRENVYYVDTDCLIVNAAGLLRLQKAGLVKTNVLGYLGPRWGPSKVEIRGIKYYIHDDIVVCAGVPDAQKVCPIDSDTYYRLHAPADDVRRGRRPRGAVSLARYVKSLKYRHGRVRPDGRVEPLTAGRI